MPAFLPGPGTTHVRLQVLRSTATIPLRAFIWQTSPPVLVFRPLWDDTRSTGPQDVVWGEEPIFGLLLSTNNELLSAAADTTWAFSALDRDGKDVGFTCVTAQR